MRDENAARSKSVPPEFIPFTLCRGTCASGSPLSHALHSRQLVFDGENPFGNAQDACSEMPREHKCVFVPRLPVHARRRRLLVTRTLTKTRQFPAGFFVRREIAARLAVQPRCFRSSAPKKNPRRLPAGDMLSDCCRPRTKPIRSCDERGSREQRCSGP